MDQEVDVGIGIPYRSLPKDATEIFPKLNWNFDEVYTIHSPHGPYEAKLDSISSNVYYPVWEQLDSEIGKKENLLESINISESQQPLRMECVRENRYYEAIERKAS
jgi:hypothetical protein